MSKVFLLCFTFCEGVIMKDDGKVGEVGVDPIDVDGQGQSEENGSWCGRIPTLSAPTPTSQVTALAPAPADIAVQEAVTAFMATAPVPVVMSSLDDLAHRCMVEGTWIVVNPDGRVCAGIRRGDLLAAVTAMLNETEDARAAWLAMFAEAERRMTTLLTGVGGNA